ncbi:MAG: hypothetical protein GC161_12810 [Planctomycetaceae bacterium]|nr:hypothetical protein [Planctomycetaceae bacterium]
MKSSLFQGSVAASVLLVAVGAAMAVNGQDPARSSPQVERESQNPTQRDSQNPTQRESQNSAQQDRMGKADSEAMREIGSAYQSLHQVTLRVLEEKSRNWKDNGQSGTTAGAEGERTPSAQTPGMGSSTAIRGQELLIAACRDGLLAGAPSGERRAGASGATGGMGNNRDAGNTGTPGDAGTERGAGTSPSAQRPGERQGAGLGAPSLAGEVVGMILICEHSNEGIARGGATAGQNDRRAGEASSERESAMPRNAGSGRLVPGVYSVQQTGQSVWLTDQEGQVVLRTTIEGRGIDTMSTDREQRRDGGMERGTGRNAGDQSGQPGQNGQSGQDEQSGQNGRTDQEGQVGRTGQSDQRQQGAITTAAPGGHHEWEQVFGAITKEAMTSLGWSQTSAAPSRR